VEEFEDFEEAEDVEEETFAAECNDEADADLIMVD
jgi:hypothetical protein